jgi:hypothetical protein
LDKVVRWAWKPWLVALGIVGLYAFALLGSANGDPLIFVRMGTRYANQDPHGSNGYDGQFYYYIAAAPL